MFFSLYIVPALIAVWFGYIALRDEPYVTVHEVMKFAVLAAIPVVNLIFVVAIVWAATADKVIWRRK